MTDPTAHPLVETLVAIDGDVASVKVRGELDAHTVGEVERVLTPVAEDGPTQLVLDVSDVGFVDSSGLRVLLGLRRRLVARGGQLRLVELSSAFRRLLDLTGLLDELTGVR
jgi:anti-sigma B factor antagonist